MEQVRAPAQDGDGPFPPRRHGGRSKRSSCAPDRPDDSHELVGPEKTVGSGRGIAPRHRNAGIEADHPVRADSAVGPEKGDDVAELEPSERVAFDGEPVPWSQGREHTPAQDAENPALPQTRQLGFCVHPGDVSHGTEGRQLTAGKRIKPSRCFPHSPALPLTRVELSAPDRGGFEDLLRAEARLLVRSSHLGRGPCGG